MIDLAIHSWMQVHERLQRALLASADNAVCIAPNDDGPSTSIAAPLQQNESARNLQKDDGYLNDIGFDLEMNDIFNSADFDINKENK